MSDTIPCPAPGCNVTFQADLAPQALVILLELHIRTTHPPPTAPQVTEAMDDKKVNLRVHAATYIKEGRCPECGLTFSRLASLKAHIIKHEQDDEVKCHKCQVYYPTKTALEEHKVEHRAGSVNQVMTCKTCSEQFTSRLLYTQHHHQHHKIKEALRVRTKRRKLHMMQRSKFPHVCDICSKRFQKHALLSRHKLIHSGEKPFKCTVCDEAFNQKTSLHIHSMKHTGIRPHKCSFCPSAFSQKGNLRIHITRCHSAPPGVSTVNCKQCSCRFKSKRYLTKHMRKLHQVDAAVTEVTESNVDVKQDNPQPRKESHKESHKPRSDILAEATAEANVISYTAPAEQITPEDDVATEVTGRIGTVKLHYNNFNYYKDTKPLKRPRKNDACRWICTKCRKGTILVENRDGEYHVVRSTAHGSHGHGVKTQLTAIKASCGIHKKTKHQHDTSDKCTAEAQETMSGSVQDKATAGSEVTVFAEDQQPLATEVVSKRRTIHLQYNHNTYFKDGKPVRKPRRNDAIRWRCTKCPNATILTEKRDGGHYVVRSTAHGSHDQVKSQTDVVRDRIKMQLKVGEYCKEIVLEDQHTATKEKGWLVRNQRVSGCSDLHFGAHIYKLRSGAHSSITWQCEYKSCRGKIITNHDITTLLNTTQHLLKDGSVHAPSNDLCKAKLAMAALKQSCKNGNLDKTNHIVKSALGELTDDSRLLLPRNKHISRRVREWKSAKPRSKKCVNDLKITGICSYGSAVVEEKVRHQCHLCGALLNNKQCLHLHVSLCQHQPKEDYGTYMIVKSANGEVLNLLHRGYKYCKCLTSKSMDRTEWVCVRKKLCKCPVRVTLLSSGKLVDIQGEHTHSVQEQYQGKRKEKSVTPGTSDSVILRAHLQRERITSPAVTYASVTSVTSPSVTSASVEWTSEESPAAGYCSEQAVSSISSATVDTSDRNKCISRTPDGSEYVILWPNTYQKL